MLIVVYENDLPSILNMSSISPAVTNPARRYSASAAWFSLITCKSIHSSRATVGRPLARMGDQRGAQAGAPMAPVHAHAQQAAMAGEAVRMRAQVDVADDAALRRSAPPKCGASLWRRPPHRDRYERRLALGRQNRAAMRHGLEISRFAAVVGQMVVQVGDEIGEFGALRREGSIAVVAQSFVVQVPPGSEPACRRRIVVYAIRAFMSTRQ